MEIGVERRGTYFGYAKWYLLGLFIVLHGVALLDHHGMAYFPIEVASLLATHHTRKSIFLAGIVPICLFLWIEEADDWPLRGIGMSLFLMTLFDVANEWPLHIVGVMLFAFCVARYANKTGRDGLFKATVALYSLKVLLKLLYVWSYEYGTQVSLPQRMKELSAMGCSGYVQCEQPLMTEGVLKFAALIQWSLFILLALIIV